MTTTNRLQFCAVVCTPTPSGFLFPLVAAAPLEGGRGGGRSMWSEILQIYYTYPLHVGGLEEVVGKERKLALS